MFKQLLNEAILDIAIQPQGPVLIKSGELGGADPTHADMEFVRTVGQVFIPGSSLKGVVRAHAEKIARSLQPQVGPGRGACNPLDTRVSCGGRLERNQAADTRYAESCFACRLFGSTAVAGRVRFADALPSGAVLIEERNGVAIDRVYGSVAVGPFNYETVVGGEFPTTIDFRNVTLAQLGLLGLALRDLAEGRVALGFGKSRGLGHIKASFEGLELRYPTCMRRGGKLLLLNGHEVSDLDRLAGLGAFPAGDAYYLPKNDTAALPGGLAYADDEETGLGVKLATSDSAQVKAIFRACMDAWKLAIGWAA
jgi:CRISPR-associated RAMP protein (TIGR02581 family)